MTDRLRGKVALVVGAGTSGVGLGNGTAVAVAMAREGARVMAADIDAAALEETHRLVTSEGGECEIFVGDMTQADAVRDLVDFTHASFGAVSILHNNIGVFVPGGPVDLEEERWDHIMRTNLRPVFLTCKYVLPEMVADRSGVIVNVGSISGQRYMGLPQIAYSTSKAGVAAFTRSVAAQYGPKGIRANTLSPGIIDTPMLSNAMQCLGETADAETKNRIASREQAVPLQAFGEAHDVASAAVFLASAEAKYINGIELVVDGGLIAVAPG